jgi:hypothetical protein
MEPRACIALSQLEEPAKDIMHLGRSCHFCPHRPSLPTFSSVGNNTRSMSELCRNLALEIVDLIRLFTWSIKSHWQSFMSCFRFFLQIAMVVTD